MSDKSDLSDTNGLDDPLPDDAICAADAAKIACMSTTTLRRRARSGQFRWWFHPNRSGYWYSQADMEAHRAEFRRGA